ncbi:MAG: hypothetical protein AB7I19_09490 [Planctomycetota bacterium]
MRTLSHSVPFGVALRLAQALLSPDPQLTHRAAPGDVLEVPTSTISHHAWIARSSGEVERIQSRQGKLRIAVPDSAARGSTLVVVAGDAVARIVVE